MEVDENEVIYNVNFKKKSDFVNHRLFLFEIDARSFGDEYFQSLRSILGSYPPKI